MNPAVTDWARTVAESVQQTLQERTRRSPEVTYRLQFHPERFTFRDAIAIVPYLSELGVSHVYTSPCLMARRGSPHGYDTVDHHRLNPELGTQEDYEQLIAALQDHGMGQILDIVPNHMGIATSENRWWYDVLENGPSSPYANYFDIDWRPVKTELRNRVLLPMLGDQYGEVLESGQLKLKREAGAFILQYFELKLPIEPSSYAVILSHQLDELKTRLGAEAAPLIELESILTALEHLPYYDKVDDESVAERQREKEVVKNRLARLADESAEIADFIERNVREFNGDPEQPRSFDRLDDLLERQVYRLSHWTAASDEINYRRFFDINELAAVCMEEPDVFEEAHRLVLELLADGAVDGLRIDHIDGLFDPEEYLWRLQWGCVRALGRRAFHKLHAEREAAATPAPPGEPTGEASRPADAESETPQPANPEWELVEPEFVKLMGGELGGPDVARLFPSLLPPPADPYGDLLEHEHRGTDGEADDEANAAEGGDRSIVPTGTWSRRSLPVYVVVEKILESNEDLPADWPVAGTTGYEFLNSAAGLFVDVAGARDLEKRYLRFAGRKQDPGDVVYESKRLIINMAMAAELQLLSVRISRLSEEHRRFRDFTLNNLRAALQEIIACFPVYRTYITADSAAGVSERDRQFIAVAVRRAKRRNPTLDARLFDFVRDVLLLKQPPELDRRSLRARRFFVGRFQQVSSPVMAKGVEDTAFYRHFPLSSLNEVGGEFGNSTTTGDFHAENMARRARRAGSLLCTTSHDTKRSEDLRARISVLSEIPDQWRSALSEWSRLNRKLRSELDGVPTPTRNDEYLFYQTLVGVWPPTPPDEAPEHSQHETLIERMLGYMQKATHEAKMRTSWLNPDPDYDEAVGGFVRAALEGTPQNRFLDGFREFHERIVDWGLYAALSQLVLKLTSPGVPDVYQGQEAWDFSLVDPDNRRPVDYEYRQRLLAELRTDVLREDDRADDSLLALARRLAGAPRDDRLKLFVTWQCLRFRRQRRSLFQDGRYIPLTASGGRASHIVAFGWQQESPGAEPETVAVVAVPRFFAKLFAEGNPYNTPDRDPAEIWRETSIQLEGVSAKSLTNLFTRQSVPAADGSVKVADLLAHFPVAVLHAPD